MNGLPLHPLVVHFAVSLLVGAPLLVLISLAWPRANRRLDWFTPLASFGAAVFGFVAAQTGEQLQARLAANVAKVGGTLDPLITRHVALGDALEKVSFGLVIFSTAWWLASSDRTIAWVTRMAPFLDEKPWRVISGALAGAFAVACLVLVYLAGDSGATAVWTGR